MSQNISIIADFKLPMGGEIWSWEEMPMIAFLQAGISSHHLHIVRCTALFLVETVIYVKYIWHLPDIRHTWRSTGKYELVFTLQNVRV